MKDNLILNEFFVEGNNQGRSHVLLHITEPSTPEEEKKGYFFTLAEINNSTLEQIEHLQKMIDDLESGYYETDDQEDKTAFELTLEYINRRGHHVLEYKNSLCNCLVGVMQNHKISFAYHGNPQAVLFYKNKNKELEIMDAMNDSEPLEKNTLFSSIIQGEIKDGDYFYIASPHVLDYFTLDRIKKIITTRNNRQSTEHIQKVLKEVDSDLSFGGILMHYPDNVKNNEEENTYSNNKKGSDESINKLLHSQKNTEDLLSPPLVREMKKKIGKIKNKRKKNKLNKIQKKRKKEIQKNNSIKKGSVETNFRPRENLKNTSLINTILITIGKGLVVAVFGLGKFLRKTTLWLGRIFVLLFLLITNKDNKRRDVLDNFRKNWLEKKESLTELSLFSKILFFTGILLTLVFIASITIYKVKENIQAEKQTYLNQIQAITDKKDAAEASRIYGDDERAISLLQEAKKMLQTLPENDKEKENKIKKLQTEIDSVLMKLQKIIDAHPEILIDLRQLNPEVKVEKIALIEDYLIAFGSDDTNFYKINKNGNTKEMKNHSTIPSLHKASTPKEQDMIIFTSGDDTIAQYEKESSIISAKDISFPKNENQISDLFVYNRRLYTLDTTNNQIYKHNITQTGYDRGTEWLKEDVDLSDAISLAIDGDLFVLKKDGKILKFTSGNQKNFSISGLDPKLENPIKIWTYNDLDYIYVLEPTHKRIIIFDKEGKLKNQYTSAQWNNPTGMIVEENKNIIYILDDNKIYKFNY